MYLETNIWTLGVFIDIRVSLLQTFSEDRVRSLSIYLSIYLSNHIDTFNSSLATKRSFSFSLVHMHNSLLWRNTEYIIFNILFGEFILPVCFQSPIASATTPLLFMQMLSPPCSGSVDNLPVSNHTLHLTPNCQHCSQPGLTPTLLASL